MKDLLLVIDMQNIYTKGQKWECRDTEGVAERIKTLIASDIFSRVVFTVFLASENPKGVWENYNREYAQINQDAWANELVDALKDEIERYPVYEKSVYSSLAIPEVKEAVKEADRVVVCGVVAECCVLSTVMQLIDEGVYTIYLTDGVSGLDRPKEEATELILSGLSPLHVEFLTVEEYLNQNRT